MRRLVVLVSVLALLLVTVAPAAAVGDTFFIRMTGDAERPGPGDPDGSGIALLSVNPEHGRVCYVLVVRNIGLPATGAHIHQADVNNPGPIVVPLKAPGRNGLAVGCAEADPGLLNDILNRPWAFYVNVHSEQYPAGAVRGQLGMGMTP